MDSYSNIPEVTPGDLIDSTHENQQSAAINRLEAVLTLNPPKAPVRVATTEAVSASFASDVLTGSANAVLSVDGIEPSVGDRVLVKDEVGANQVRNGIYAVTDAGSVSTPWALTRSEDLRLSNQAPGALVFVSEGEVNARTQWASKAEASFVLNSSNLEFAPLTDLVPKAPIDSPAFTGRPTAPTAEANDNSSQIATTEYVDAGLATRAPSSGIAQSAVTDLVSDLAAKAPSSGIPQSSVTNLVSDLAAKVSSSTKINGHSLSSDVSLAKSDVGLGNVDNTSDASKPISTATQAALDGKQPLDSDLTAIAALSTTGFIKRTGPGSAAAASLVAGDVPDLSATYQPLDRGWFVPQGRLCANSFDPSGDGASSLGNADLYYLPYNGNRIPLWNGSYWQAYNIPAALKITVSGFSIGLYDVYAYLSSGNVTLVSRAWSSTSSRGYNLTYVGNGGRVDPTDNTKLWLGTIYVNTVNLVTGTWDNPYQATPSLTNNLNGRRYVYNAYNRLMKYSIGGYITSGTAAPSTSYVPITSNYAVVVVGEQTNVSVMGAIYAWQFSTGTAGIYLGLNYNLGSGSSAPPTDPLPASAAYIPVNNGHAVMVGGANVGPGIVYWNMMWANNVGATGTQTWGRNYIYVGACI